MSPVYLLQYHGSISNLPYPFFEHLELTGRSSKTLLTRVSICCLGQRWLNRTFDLFNKKSVFLEIQIIFTTFNVKLIL